MATATETEVAYENPLIPNAKLRQMYLAMLRARILGRALKRRRPARDPGAFGLEACLVSTSVDLGPRDLVSDTLGGGTVDFLRGATAQSILRPRDASKRRGTKANSGAAARLPVALGVEQRIWAALGAAAALQAAHLQDKLNAEVESQAGVAVVYARLPEVSPAIWRKALAFAAEHLLPVLFVVLPPTRKLPGAKPGGISALALRQGIPGIPVDLDDAVAIYRVSQEAIGRARIGGGAALMECVPFVLHSVAGTPDPATDAIAGLERYMLGRQVATMRWMKREAQSFSRQITK